ncbi:MAG: RNA polymerase sigma-70 factor (ECF subfamily) [Planctomycetota bacterium]|jgi:RNA polymerase sigma-70 factor (ECF subfamily)
MEQKAGQLPTDLLEHTRWLRGLARQLVKDASTADDVVQATLMAALAWGERPREGLRNWLAGVARNVARQIGRGEQRRARRERQGAVPEALPSAGEMVELVETQRSLVTAVLGLAEHYRSTIILRFFEELTPTQIAQQLGIPASTVRVRLKRGLELLREQLEAEYDGGDKHWSLALLPLAMPPRGALLTPSWRDFFEQGSGGLSAGVAVKVGLVAIVFFLGSTLVWLNSSVNSDFGSEGISRDSLGLLVADDETTTNSDSVRILEAPDARPGVTTILPLADGFIVGQVVDSAGSPLTEVRVHAVSADPRAPQILEMKDASSILAAVRTDSMGNFRLAAEAGRPYLVRAVHAAFAPAESIRCYSGERCDLALSDGFDFKFTVLSSDDNSPLRGVQIRAESLDGLYVPTAWSVAATTDENGKVSITKIPAGEFRALAKLDGYASAELRCVSSSELDLEQEFRLSTAVTVKGLVLDAATDLPLEGARIESLDQTTMTNHRGEFEIEGFDSTSTSLRGIVVVVDGYAPKTEYVRVDTIGAGQFVSIRLEQPTLAIGTVVDAAGVSLAGVDVVYRGRFSDSPMKAERHEGQTVTDLNGRFECYLHPRAGYTIGASLDGYPVATTWVRLLSGEAETVDVGELMISSAARVRGFVRDRIFSRDNPDFIELRKTTKSEGYPTTRQLVRVVGVTPQGTFEVANLAAGDYELSLKGSRGVGDKEISLLQRLSLSVRAGEELESIELRPSAPIRGVLRLPDGRVPERGIVNLLSSDGELILNSVRTGEDGSFEIVPNSAGPFQIQASDPALLLNESMTVEGVMAGTTGIELHFQPRGTGHTVSGRVLDAHGEPVGGVKIQFTDTASRTIISRVAIPDTRGWFSLSNLNDVAYDLRIMDYDGLYEPAALKSVRPGDTDVEFSLRRHE